MVPQKVQIDDETVEFIETYHTRLNFKSKSEYMRSAIEERIRQDRRRLREEKRQAAMAAYGGEVEAVFEAIEGEDFEER